MINVTTLILKLSISRFSMVMFLALHPMESILTHTSNAKCFRNVTLINIGGLAVIIVPFRGYGRHSLKQVMIKR